MNQRWRNYRSLYRPAGEVVEPRDYEVAPQSTATRCLSDSAPPSWDRSFRMAGVRAS